MHQEATSLASSQGRTSAVRALDTVTPSGGPQIHQLKGRASWVDLGVGTVHHVGAHFLYLRAGNRDG